MRWKLRLKPKLLVSNLKRKRKTRNAKKIKNHLT